MRTGVHELVGFFFSFLPADILDIHRKRWKKKRGFVFVYLYVFINLKSNTRLRANGMKEAFDALFIFSLLFEQIPRSRGKKKKKTKKKVKVRYE